MDSQKKKGSSTALTYTLCSDYKWMTEIKIHCGLQGCRKIVGIKDIKTFLTLRALLNGFKAYEYQGILSKSACVGLKVFSNRNALEYGSMETALV